jgi:hypothetical protein
MRVVGGWVGGWVRAAFINKRAGLKGTHELNPERTCRLDEQHGRVQACGPILREVQRAHAREAEESETHTLVPLDIGQVFQHEKKSRCFRGRITAKDSVRLGDREGCVLRNVVVPGVGIKWSAHA